MSHLAQTRQELGNRSLDALADWMAEITPGSNNDQVVRAEFLRRQTEYQREATQAAKEAAIATRKSARYMLWSVIALVITTVITDIINMIICVGPDFSGHEFGVKSCLKEES